MKTATGIDFILPRVTLTLTEENAEEAGLIFDAYCAAITRFFLLATISRAAFYCLSNIIRA